MIAMDKIEPRFFSKTVEQRFIPLSDRVPAHVRDFQTRMIAEPPTWARTFLGTRSSSLTEGAHQLHTKADAEERLLQGEQSLIEMALLHIAHRREASPTPGNITREAERSTAGSSDTTASPRDG